jgi:hypothetical protein
MRVLFALFCTVLAYETYTNQRGDVMIIYPRQAGSFNGTIEKVFLQGQRTDDGCITWHTTELSMRTWTGHYRSDGYMIVTWIGVDAAPFGEWWDNTRIGQDIFAKA